MGITSAIVAVGSFTVGVVAGVFLCERGMLDMLTIQRGGALVVDKSKQAAVWVRTEFSAAKPESKVN